MSWKLYYGNSFSNILSESKDLLQFKWKLLELIKTIDTTDKCEDGHWEKHMDLITRLEKLETSREELVKQLVTHQMDVYKRLEKLERWSGSDGVVKAEDGDAEGLEDI